jgi:DNA modification methylase
VASPKRGAMERRGLHAWHPYYAGYSAAFVADILSELKIDSDRVVLDPMNGSGTTTLVAQQRGHLSIGIELNPAMVVMARAKDPVFSNNASLIQMAEEVVDGAVLRTHRVSRESCGAGWIPPTAFGDLKRLDAELLARDETALLPLDSRLLDFVPKGEQVSGGRRTDFLRAALLVTSRRVAATEDSKNPTWPKPGNGQLPRDVTVFDSFKTVAAVMASELNATFTRRPEARRSIVLHADARKLPLPESSVDAIVTSPPYLTRIDYAVGTAPELVLLGYESEEARRELRRAIMGSTCVTGGAYDLRPSWGRTCLDILDRVRRHPSKASATYYFKMHVQYFRDAEAVLRECLRVLKPGTAAVFVVQDSWYKDIHVPLDKIYAEMARQLGAASADTISSETVRNHMGLVNTRAKRYRKGTLHEHVVLLRKG